MIVPDGAARAFLAPLPVVPLGDIAPTLERLGIRTLGELAALGEASVADRFGPRGLRALRLARGEDCALRPRDPQEILRERLELPEAASGLQLERALALLIDRLLAAPERRGRTLRGLWLTARLAAGGGWRSRVTLRSASASPERLRLALLPRLVQLPGPADQLGLEAAGFGPAAAEQLSLEPPRGLRRRRRLAEAVRQVRSAVGRDAVLHVLEVEPNSRIPERRAILTPFQLPPECSASRPLPAGREPYP